MSMELKIMYIAMPFHFSSASWQVALRGLWCNEKKKKTQTAVPLRAPTETDCGSFFPPRSIRCLSTQPLTVAFQHYWSILDCFCHGLCIILVFISKRNCTPAFCVCMHKCVLVFLHTCTCVCLYTR